MKHDLRGLCIGVLFVCGWFCADRAMGAAPIDNEPVEVVVIGGTPGGIAAAITAARLGHRVAMVESHHHLGGMTASGLGKTDIETPQAIGGLFREFVGRVHDYYRRTYGVDSESVKLCREGYFYEPSVAEQIFKNMVADETRIRVHLGYELQAVEHAGNRIRGVTVVGPANDTLRLRGQVFIDATYEGDLAAGAKAKYRLGRESRSEFGELNAGVVYQDYTTRAFLAGSTGEGDRRLQAYTFRLCLTDDPKNGRPLTSPPANYDRSRYVGYLDDWRAGRLGTPGPTAVRPGSAPSVGTSAVNAPSVSGTVVRAFSIAAIPNHKFDVNMNPRPLAFPFADENYDYPEASASRRAEITDRIRDLTLGLLYFLQNDPDVPMEHRQIANHFHLPQDEFVDNQNFPWQLYVREARRIVGLYTLSEQDVVLGPDLGRTRVHADSIAAGEFPIDSFPVRKHEPGHDNALEGYLLMQAELTKPYQIPYRIMVPETVDGLLVPVAASTTHVAFSTIRLEPTWMALGQAAGAAAHLAIRNDQALRAVEVDTLQRLLIAQRQVITYFQDIDVDDPASASLQYFGTKGFFASYRADAKQPLSRELARQWIAKLPRQPPGAQRLDGLPMGSLTNRELANLLASEQSSEPPEMPITRGEFCRALYEWLGRN